MYVAIRCVAHLSFPDFETLMNEEIAGESAE